MPNELSPGHNGTRVNLADAPGADLDWDSLFPNPELQPASQSQPVTTGTTPQPTENQFFLRTDDGSIAYRTAEEAIKGISHKDTEVAKYRNFLKQKGIDPNTGEAFPSQAQPNQPAAPQVGHLFDEIADAATRGDKVKYETTLKNFLRDVVREEVTPWRPTLAEMNRLKAARQVSVELPGFKDFYEGDGFRKTIENNPLFKDMNEIGENNPEAAGRLPELYRSMYFYYRGMQPASQTTTSTTQTTPTGRTQPTLQPSALTPPAPTPNYAKDAWAQPITNRLVKDSNQARKDLIADGDAKFNNARFEDYGY